LSRAPCFLLPLSLCVFESPAGLFFGSFPFPLEAVVPCCPVPLFSFCLFPFVCVCVFESPAGLFFGVLSFSFGCGCAVLSRTPPLFLPLFFCHLCVRIPGRALSPYLVILRRLCRVASRASISFCPFSFIRRTLCPLGCPLREQVMAFHDRPTKLHKSPSPF